MVPLVKILLQGSSIGIPKGKIGPFYVWLLTQHYKSQGRPPCRCVSRRSWVSLASLPDRTNQDQEKGRGFKEGSPGWPCDSWIDPTKQPLFSKELLPSNASQTDQADA